MLSVPDRSKNMSARISNALARIEIPKPIVEGKLSQIVGMRLEVQGCCAAIGSSYHIQNSAHSGQQKIASVEAEVVGFATGKLLLMPLGSLEGIQPNARVIPKEGGNHFAVGEQMIGRVFDGAGEPLDEGPAIKYTSQVPTKGRPINPLKRKPISQALDVGVRAINALLTLGKGQRIGLFAGSGVGKTTLLGMMTRHTSAEVVVIALVGERGKEVREFIEQVLSEEGLRKAIVIATPADDPPLRRIQGAWRATAIAEYFRDQGRDVLLLMDSLTRFAQAQREVGLAIGEPPVTRGYTPSVFSLLPSLVERAGNGDDECGSITAVYTVLTEGDDANDPIADAARAILDGHIMMSRDIAESGIYPAIDIEASVSRSMNAIANPDQQRMAQDIKARFSCYRKNQDLISIGAYKRGTDSEIDSAIRSIPGIRSFVSQNYQTKEDMTASLIALEQLSQHGESLALKIPKTDVKEIAE